MNNIKQTIVELLNQKNIRRNPLLWTNFSSELDNAHNLSKWNMDDTENDILSEISDSLDNVAGLSDDIKFESIDLESSGQYWLEAAIKLFGVIEEFGFVEIVPLDRFKVISSWCSDNLNGKYLLTEINEYMLIIIVDEHDASVFKLWWK